MNTVADAITDVMPAVKVEQRQVSQALHAGQDLHSLARAMLTLFRVARTAQRRTEEISRVDADPMRCVAYSLFMAASAFYASLPSDISMPGNIRHSLLELRGLAYGRHEQCAPEKLRNAVLAIRGDEARYDQDTFLALQGAMDVLRRISVRGA